MAFALILKWLFEHLLEDMHMNTQISSKLAALAIALMMNTALVAAVAYLFDAQIQQHPTVVSLESATMHEVV
jgi:hypothetical protein